MRMRLAASYSYIPSSLLVEIVPLKTQVHAAYKYICIGLNKIFDVELLRTALE